MFLKTLEVQGFKSFAEKTVLEFTGDITAIVGPNGSGKSNISDAIRWVLGEQSTKTLRGTKMEDVIFGGTQSRPAKGFAEASLIFDNSDSSLPVDSSEVMITRRYFRSGESEYYINRRQVRLRDVNELFMDTGLGKEGYSNIGQGKIDEILSLKSTERRAVFEEAAGISAYRFRKEETERKLENTEDNLLRIGDKISELELQLEPLREQADKAQKYLLLRDDLRRCEIALWTEDIARIARDKEKTDADYRSAAFIVDRERSNQDEMYRLVEELSLQVREADESIELLRGKIEELTERYHDSENDKTALVNEIAGKQTAFERLQSELQSDSERAEKLTESVLSYEMRLTEIQKRTEELIGKKGEAEEKLRALTGGSCSFAAKAAELKNSISEGKTSLAAMNTERTAGELAAKEAAADEQTLGSELAAAEKRIEQLTETVALHKKSLLEAEEEITAAGNSAHGYELRIAAKKKKLETVSGDLNECRGIIRESNSRLTLLKELEKNYEGFSHSVKHVMQEAEKSLLSGIHGPVSTLLRTEDRYALAIETALGAAGQNIIVDTERDGERAIAFLKRKDLGRVTFLPMDVIRGSMLKEQNVSKMPGFIGIASGLVSFSKDYSQIVQYLLGRTVIADTMAAAIQIAGKFGHSFRIVTLDGQVLNAGGSMTGGSAAFKAGVLTRANEIDELNARMSVMLQKSKELENDEEAARKSLQADEFEYGRASETLKTYTNVRIRAESELSGAEKLLDTIRASADSLKQGITASALKQKRLQERNAELEAKTRELESFITECETALEKAEAEIKTVSDAEKLLSDEIGGIASDISALRSEKEASEAALAQFRILSQQLASEQHDRKTLFADFEKELLQLNERLPEFDLRITEKAEEINGEKVKLDSLLYARNQSEERKEKTLVSIRGKGDEILEMEREKSRLAGKLAVFEQNEKQLLDKLWDSYGLTFSAARNEAALTESFTATQKKTAELRRKIAALGTPNLGAIEEFNRVNERYTYLSGQQNDVLKAKNNLESILKNVTAEMTAIFCREFERINTYFGETFVEMFGGGKAGLYLEDPASPLESGIEIKVQPPGKQLKTITLLSGGEKAFVAIALYFAIMKVRPAPFCMLDEIDAALDDRNVDRFASYLRGLSRKTQFIVITHRRGTMEAADMLYGVTMQERGVSAILRLNLDDISVQLGIEV